MCVLSRDAAFEFLIFDCIQRPEGRAKKFVGLTADWNNQYHQALDVQGTGQPVLSNIIQVCGLGQASQVYFIGEDEI